ncbi:hypothetical protein Dvina_17175 [Dactylosporangium vinaceum]|uniref:DUF2690 domain-containing protein n=1 Tax=Dactylosporangium vinaceum TaxID=53362 RepID=A0ABV5MK96_9ACTN|nr:hypothetical protein [Dactylosporangium vinaceum]UAB99646.1 hypothetical protein Dvina_17175 [Dactylosporangium vinaceum]
MITNRLTAAVSLAATMIVFAVGGVTLTATPAAASASVCASSTDQSCAGQNPANCANPGTVRPDGVWISDASNDGTVWGLQIFAPDFSGSQTEVGWLQLRWSPTCKMNWARIIFTHAFHGEISAWNPNRPSQTSWIGYDGSGNHFTPTVNGIAQACVGMQVYLQGVYRQWDFGYCV